MFLQRVVSENDESSELLPDGWNSNSSSFTLRYLCNEKVFVLLGTVSQDTLVLNLIVRFVDKGNRKHNRT